MRVIKGDTRSLDSSSYAGFLKLGVLFWGVPIIRIVVSRGLYWVPPFFGKLPYSCIASMRS